MVLTGSNLPAVGEYNRAVVLDAIRRAPGGVSRVDIAVTTALSGQTVSNVCKVLLERGLLRSVGTRVNGRGKPPLLLELNPDGGFAVGVHIDPAVITYVLIDLTGTVRARRQQGTPRVQDPSSVVETMAEAVQSLIADSGVDREKVLGVGIASPGPIDVVNGVVLDPPMLPRWHRVPLRSALSAAVNLPVLLDKDVTAATVAELWSADRAGGRSFLFVYYGTGLAAGIAVDGEVLRGVTSNAGDPGHLTVDPTGPVCSCGRHGCVGDMAVPRGLVRIAVERGILQPGSVGDRTELGLADATAFAQAFLDLVARADAGEAAAQALIEEAARWLAHAVTLMVNLLDVSEVVFGGPFWNRISDTILRILPSAVTDDHALLGRDALAFMESGAVEDGTALGAGILVLDNTLSPKPRALLLVGD